MAKTFIWLIDSCTTRKGRKLVTGNKFKLSDFPPDVVDEWIKTKAAKWAESKSIKEKE